MRASTSPIMALPPELLSTIFESFIGTFSPLSGKSSPFVLGMVCRYWHNVSVATPTIWSSFKLDFLSYAWLDGISPNTMTKHDSPRRLNLLSLWLQRSGKAPISFQFHGSESQMAVSRQLFQRLLLHSKRWRHVVLNVPHSFLDELKGDMSMLKYLNIDPHKLPSTNDQIHIIDNAPELTHVVLGDCFVLAAIHLPWKQLTHITGVCLYKREAFHLIQIATRLLRLELHVIDDSDDIRTTETEIKSNVRHLEIWLRKGNLAVSEVLSSLFLPSLEFLFVHQPHIKPQHLYALGAMIHRSDCPLREIRLDVEDHLHNLCQTTLLLSIPITFGRMDNQYISL
ncbi:hypothetical protein MIND_01256300 [Mycena indigotica]|uniref:F-box domain-containing protein n=1 Tax=Mycena indigotica TaxID=2126181 RepID=A0A8H6S319_9AGAR|nr:uncharacterized protein MIND_01256300 [Mycena indigotica]KAF7291131.1 hypothetical protein MIND_01256300 [Mycena indigotica]